MIAHEPMSIKSFYAALLPCTATSNFFTSILNWMTSRNVPEAGGEIRGVQ